MRRPARWQTRATGVALAGIAFDALAMAQTPKPMSPDGVAQAQVLGTWVKGARPAFSLGRETYENGKWIEIAYGRPLQRGRDVFGAGETYSAVEQLTWSFVDMTAAGGRVAIMWGKTMASTPFKASN